MNIYDDTPETANTPKTQLPSRRAALNAIRSSRDYQTARTQYRTQAATHRNPDGTYGAGCWLCGQPINYALKYPHPRSWTLDHATPITQNPNLALTSSNFRSAHFDCNNHRGTDTPHIDLGEPSEIWGFLLLIGFGLVNWLHAWHPATTILGKS